MTRIDQKLVDLRRRGQRAFIPYITAGDPDLETTRKLVLALERTGADIIELGVPFSDPIADGPVIQRATERALANRVSLEKVLELVRQIRRESQTPLLAMSYVNPLLKYGLERLADHARNAGLDGLLASDLTVEESDRFGAIMQSAGLNTVFLAAPTSSPDRVKKIAAASTGFVYAVSRTGVTGEQQNLAADLRDFLTMLRKYTDAPIAVGFGISRPEHVRAVWREADGAVVGSAIVAEVERNIGRPDLVDRVAAFTSWIRGVGDEH
jgi:tryptophan synthase alpha chain